MYFSAYKSHIYAYFETAYLCIFGFTYLCIFCAYLCLWYIRTALAQGMVNCGVESHFLAKTWSGTSNIGGVCRILDGVNIILEGVLRILDGVLQRIFWGGGGT